MSRIVELLEGDNGKFSMRVLCTYLVTFTLCFGVIMSLKTNDGGTAIGLAGILSTLMGIIYGIGKVVDGSVAKASLPQSPSSESASS
jgi:uncharacterized MnhB-related membrane protein